MLPFGHNSVVNIVRGVPSDTLVRLAREQVAALQPATPPLEKASPADLVIG